MTVEKLRKAAEDFIEASLEHHEQAIRAAVKQQRQKDAAIARDTRSVDGWQDFYDRAAELIADAIEAQE